LQATKNEVQKVINVDKLLRYGLSPSEVTVEAEKELVKTYIQHYHEALPLGASLPSTELQPADDFALLAGNTFVNLWHLSKDYSHLYSAASFLEFALSKSKQSFLTRTILIRIYRLVGMFESRFYLD
jgi:N-terminal acetyltransferase B complex non-catalytic subunit